MNKEITTLYLVILWPVNSSATLPKIRAVMNQFPPVCFYQGRYICCIFSYRTKKKRIEHDIRELYNKPNRLIGIERDSGYLEILYFINLVHSDPTSKHHAELFGQEKRSRLHPGNTVGAPHFRGSDWYRCDDSSQ